jgi:GTP-binding protein LepA
MSQNIRNFVIIAHIDHGKSTLADRFLEVTHTIEARKMKPQLLDTMDLERERGITIKMQPVRMAHAVNQETYILNLIDTPGHIDFSYEVSRALAAVEGALLLVDATQGVQAQTLTNLYIAEQQGLAVIPVVNKIDMEEARIEETKQEIRELLGVSDEDIFLTSGKTGTGVAELLEAVVQKVPSPQVKEPRFKALIFDSQYESHRGIIAYVRVFGGQVRKGDKLKLFFSDTAFEVKEVGTFAPVRTTKDVLEDGEIGYIVTAIKDSSAVKIGDTIVKVVEADRSKLEPLSGYREPKPMIWASFYPEDQEEFDVLKEALERLQLNDAALTFEIESSQIMGRSFKCGFLGMLHLEIIAERLKREFNLSVITTSPSVAYKIQYKNDSEEVISSPAKFPSKDQVVAISEPWFKVEIIVPSDYLGEMLKLVDLHEGVVTNTETFGMRGQNGAEPTKNGERLRLDCELPLREIISDFFDSLKSVSSGYASMSYEDIGFRPADVDRLDILVAEELVPAFSRIVSRRKLPTLARETVSVLKDLLPRQLFVVKIQAKAEGRIIASESISALKKDVTGYLYGGDRTRKMKLWKKQKRGKERLREHGKVEIPPTVFLKMMKK